MRFCQHHNLPRHVDDHDQPIPTTNDIESIANVVLIRTIANYTVPTV